MATSLSEKEGDSKIEVDSEINQVNDEKEEEKLKEPNFLLRLILNHYRDADSKRSNDQEEEERWLFPSILPGIPFNRYFLIPAAVLVQFCVGSLYSWSVFNKPIENYIFGETRNLSPYAFYLACGSLGISAALMGPWLERNGPKKAALLGSLLFVLGHLLTAVGVYLKSIYLVFFSYGILGGFGIGLSYISPVSALQKWFQDKKGLASGCAVAGFGGGSIAVGKVILPLIDVFGLPLTFVVLACVYCVVMTFSALILRNPPSNYSVHGIVSNSRPSSSLLHSSPSNENDKNKNYCEMTFFRNKNSVVQSKLSESPTNEDTNLNDNLNLKDHITSPKRMTLIEALTSTDFRLIYIVFLANILFCLCSISRLSDMIIDVFARHSTEASTVVSINGCFNIGGRLAFSIFSDLIGRKSCYFIMLTSQLVIVGTFSIVTSEGAYTVFVGMIWLLMAIYGAGFGTLPAYLSDLFGSKNVGAVHGVSLTAWSLSGVVGGFIYAQVFKYFSNKPGYEKSDPHPYNVNAWWIWFIVLLGWISLLFVTPTEKDFIFRRRVSRFFRRLFSRNPPTS